MRKKQGLSMLTMILYVILFFAFSSIAVAISTNMNLRLLKEKGQIIVNEEFKKLEYNMLGSAKKSTAIDEISGKVAFSNGDEYYYNQTEGKIYKNDGVLVSDVKEFEIIEPSNLTYAPDIFLQDMDTLVDSVCMQVKFEKYDMEYSSQIFVTAGDGVYE